MISTCLFPTYIRINTKVNYDKIHLLNMENIQNIFFNSPTWGVLTINEVIAKITLFIKEAPEHRYNLVIGTDSQTKNGFGVDFITAIVIHRIGSGGIYFWKKEVENKKMVLHARIYQEALLSLDTAKNFLEQMKKSNINKFEIEIHVDIGPKGETKVLISEIVGMIKASGFEVKTKPLSYCASNVADRHT
jgi:uncharacterized protein